MHPLLCRFLGQDQAYEPIMEAMKRFTEDRKPGQIDEIWFLEHQPVYTLGRAGEARHILSRDETPIIASNRGGQVTWHGPGQLVAYTLFDLERLGMSVRMFVSALEQTVIDLLQHYGIHGSGNPKAPGVYVEGAKIASIGLRIRRQYSYHGISLNVCNDLDPFHHINPCGYPGLEVTRLSRLVSGIELIDVRKQWIQVFESRFGFSS
ncbi:MAG: lipoyl(octanoyl) transferase LipB, partial [Gammaproteobacteria bacterium]